MKHVLITGASSGIGRALALHYADNCKVIACGRSQSRLDELSRHDNISTRVFDVANRAAVLREGEVGTPLDLVILNAGTCEYIDDPRHFDSALFERVLRSNLLGIAYCLEAFLPHLRSGAQLVIVSSSVTRLPLPRAEAYGASKAGLSYLAKTLACDLKDVDVTLVEPGFVKTPLTDKNDFSMPFRVSPQTAVKHIAQGVEKRKTIVRFPTRFMLLLNLFRLMPFCWWKGFLRGVRR